MKLFKHQMFSEEKKPRHHNIIVAWKILKKFDPTYFCCSIVGHKLASQSVYIVEQIYGKNILCLHSIKVNG